VVLRLNHEDRVGVELALEQAGGAAEHDLGSWKFTEGIATSLTFVRQVRGRMQRQT
jgi:hypothetical protein